MSLLFSDTVHLSTGCPSSTPPYSFPTSSVHSASLLPVSPQKRAGLPGDPNKTQDQQQLSLCGTNPRRKRVPRAGRVSESPTRSFSAALPKD